MEKNIDNCDGALEKISVENCKISNFAYSLAGRFQKSLFSTANLNNFQRISLLKLYTFVNDDTPKTFGNNFSAYSNVKEKQKHHQSRLPVSAWHYAKNWQKRFTQPSKCTVNSSHGQVVTQSTRHNAVLNDGQLVTRF